MWMIYWSVVCMMVYTAEGLHQPVTSYENFVHELAHSKKDPITVKNWTIFGYFLPLM